STANRPKLTVIYTAGPPTDMSVTKSDAPDPVVAGSTLTYTLAARNLSTVTATAVTLTDTLPGSVSFISATPSAGSCSFSAGTVTCPLGSVAGGAVVNITIVVGVATTASGILTNTASVTQTEL